MKIFVNGVAVDPAMLQEIEADVRQEYYAELSQLPQDIATLKTNEVIRERAIERMLILEKARAEEIKISKAQMDEFVAKVHKERFGGKKKIPHLALKMIEEEALMRIKMRRMFESWADRTPEPTEEEIQTYYEKYTERFSTPEEIRAAHILKQVTSSDEAEPAEVELRAIYNQVLEGKDFLEAAKEHSDCPSKESDLGWFSRGKMVKPFEDVVFALELGQISEPFLTDFGWHIVRVEEKRAASVQPLEAVKEDISQELLAKAREKSFRELVQSLKAEAEIVVN